MMTSLRVFAISLLAASLLCFGCKGEEKAASFYEHNVSTLETKGAQVGGKWMVDSMSLASVSVPAFCNRIGEGAIFEFTDNDSLRIYLRDALKPCDVFSFTAQDGLMHLIKDDMIMLINYKFTTDRKLVLNSNSFFRMQEDAVADTLTSTTLDKGITVILIKNQ